MSEASFPEIAPVPAVMGMKEVCELIGITAETARRLINDGALPGHRVPGGRQWVFRTEEVLAAISAWSVDREGEDAAGSQVVQVDEHHEDPRLDSEGANDQLTAITCPAPQRLADETSWLQACAEEWARTARVAGFPDASASDVKVRVGGVEHRLRVEECELAVVDDFGDATSQPIHVVSVEPLVNT